MLVCFCLPLIDHSLIRFLSFSLYFVVVISGGPVDWVKFLHMLLFMHVLLLMVRTME